MYDMLTISTPLSHEYMKNVKIPQDVIIYNHLIVIIVNNFIVYGYDFLEKLVLKMDNNDVTRKFYHLASFNTNLSTPEQRNIQLQKQLYGIIPDIMTYCINSHHDKYVKVVNDIADC